MSLKDEASRICLGSFHSPLAIVLQRSWSIKNASRWVFSFLLWVSFRSVMMVLTKSLSFGGRKTSTKGSKFSDVGGHGRSWAFLYASKVLSQMLSVSYILGLAWLPNLHAQTTASSPLMSELKIRQKNMQPLSSCLAVVNWILLFTRSSSFVHSFSPL